MTFAAQLLNHRDRMGESQETVARLLDMTLGRYRRYESGKVVPSATEQEGALARLAKLQPSPSPR